MKYIFIFLLGVITSTLLSFEQFSKLKIRPVSESRVDTVAVSDSIFQIVEYGKSGVESIKLGEVSKKGSIQSITFHSNGTLKQVQMITDVRLDLTEKYKQYEYQLNLVEFSEDGILMKCDFMKDFESLNSYPKRE